MKGDLKKNFGALLFVLLITWFLYPDDKHYINVFIGDRAAGMSGAYTAIADGPEGVYYNPAGLAYSTSRYFSLSVNAVQFKFLKYNDVFYDSKTNFDYTRYSFSFIPNFFGFIQRQKHFTFAVTVACLDSEFYDQRDNKYLNYADNLGRKVNINFNYVDMTYEIGTSFAFLPHKKVAIGFGLYVNYRDIKLIYQITYKYKYVNAFELALSTFANDRIIGIKPQFGIQIMPIDQLSIGYCISFPFSIVNIHNDQSTYFGFNDPVGISTLRDNTFRYYNLAQNGFFMPAIIKQSLGVAVFITKSLVISVDGYLYIPLQNYDLQGNLLDYDFNRIANKYKLQIIGNGAIGVEWYITPNFPLRAGFFTNLTNTPTIKKGETSQFDNIHLFGGSLSLGYASSSLSINIGAAVSGGVGQSQIYSSPANPTKIINMEAITVNAYISGGYQF